MGDGERYGGEKDVGIENNWLNEEYSLGSPGSDSILTARMGVLKRELTSVKL